MFPPAPGRPTSVAAPDLLPSTSSSPDPSTADRDRMFLNHTKWYVRFQDDREAGTWINGLIYSHPSRWMTIRDEEGDILAGRHLNVGEDIAVGKSLFIDLYHIEVLECMQAPKECDEQIEFVDLSKDAEETKPAKRVGGRF